MAKKFLFVVASLCFTLTALQAQKKYEKIVYGDVSAEGENMTVLGKDAVCTGGMTKFKLKIMNKSEEIVVFKPEESTLKAQGKDMKPDEKWLEIQPDDVDSKVINFKGTGFIHPSFSYEVNGLYKISVSNKMVETPDFQLPASENSFKTGSFTCNLTDLSKETDKTTVKFLCLYTGDKIGVINTGRAAVRLPDGTEVANAKSKKSPVILNKGESKKITLVWNRMDGGKATDMQKIKLMIVWRDTFVDSDPVKLKPVTLDFKIDEAASK